MSERQHYLEIRRWLRGKWRMHDRLGPFPKPVARETLLDMRSMNNSRFWRFRVVPDRADYWKAYHAEKYASDLEYRQKKRDWANNYSRRIRAKLRGDDIRP